MTLFSLSTFSIWESGTEVAPAAATGYCIIIGQRLDLLMTLLKQIRVSAFKDFVSGNASTHQFGHGNLSLCKTAPDITGSAACRLADPDPRTSGMNLGIYYAGQSPMSARDWQLLHLSLYGAPLLHGCKLHLTSCIHVTMALTGVMVSCDGVTWYGPTSFEEIDAHRSSRQTLWQRTWWRVDIQTFQYELFSVLTSCYSPRRAWNVEQKIWCSKASIICNGP